MPFRPYQASDSLYNTGGGSSHFEEGSFLWEFRGVQATPEDCKGDPGFYVKIAAVGGSPTSVGGVLSHFCSVSDKAQFNLGTIGEAGGITTAAMGKLIANIATQKQHEAVAKALDTKLKGKRFAANAADDNYDGKVRSILVLNTIQLADTFVAPAPTAPKTAPPRPAAPAAAEDSGNGTVPADEPEPGDLEADFEKMLAEAMK